MKAAPARLRALLRLHDAAEAEAVLKESGRGRVTRVEADGDLFVCKEDRPRSLRSRAGRLWRGSRAARSYAAAQALLGAGFVVPEPVGVLEEDARSLYFARFVEGPTLSQALAGAGRARAQLLARAAAGLAARLHLAGFAFRDLKPPNLVVTRDDELVPVDLDDVSRPRRIPRRSAWRNLAALDAYGQTGPRPLGVTARWRALEVYARARSLDRPQLGALLTEVLPRSRAKRRRWSRADGT